MKRLFLSLILQLFTIYLTGSSALSKVERVLDHYDIDSLTAMAQVIVKARIIKATDFKTADGDCFVWEVTVLSALKGEIKPGQMTRVAGLEEYSKGPGIENIKAKTTEAFSKGDIVYLFLVPRDAPQGYAKYRLTNADWKVIESGSRLVWENKVYSFGQYWAPGFNNSFGFVTMTRLTFPETTAIRETAFKKRVSVSLSWIDKLKKQKTNGRLTQKQRRKILQSRAAVLKKESAHSDYIPTLLGN